MTGPRELFGLEGKTVIILGGGQGIGEATALTFAAFGANVGLVDLDASRTVKVAAQVEALGVRALTVTADLLDYDDCARAIGTIAQALGTPHALVPIIGEGIYKRSLQLTPEDWDRDILRNAGYFFFAAQAFARILVTAKTGGAIAGISSVDGIVAAPFHAPYGVAKAGLIHLVKTLAVEWADLGIRVNCVVPGSIVTPRVPDSEDSRAVMDRSLVPLRRSGEASEVAGPLVFLCSNLASYITGQAISVDGGWTAANLFNAERRPEDMRAKVDKTTSQPVKVTVPAFEVGP